LKKLRAFEPSRGFRLSNWIALIATRTTIDRLRTQKAEALCRERLVTVESAWPGNEPDEDAIVHERSQLARPALPHLSPTDRAFVEDCFRDERTARQVAHERGVAINTIYSRMFKIRRKLKRIVRRLQDAPERPEASVRLADHAETVRRAA